MFPMTAYPARPPTKLLSEGDTPFAPGKEGWPPSLHSPAAE